MYFLHSALVLLVFPISPLLCHNVSRGCPAGQGGGSAVLQGAALPGRATRALSVGREGLRGRNSNFRSSCIMNLQTKHLWN